MLDMTEKERAALFPIILSEYNLAWQKWYAEEKARLTMLLGADKIVRIDYIGSTAVPGLIAKPTVDILLEVAENTDVDDLIASMPKGEYICLCRQSIPTNDLALFLKGYTPSGFTEKVFHIHVRYPGDWDEIHFRDYLLAHPEAADAYSILKRKLKEQYEHDRDGYTNAKGEFVQAVTRRAKNPVEKMDEFFISRLDIYEDNMLMNVEGLPEGYAELAKQIPLGAKTLLDLGCGTGLEFDEIFKLHPDIKATGIDIAQPMLTMLSGKYPGKDITLVCASYLDHDFGSEQYDCIISCETMHHWTHDEKLVVYKNIYRALKPGGYREESRNDSSEFMYVMNNESGESIDIHAFEYDKSGKIIYGIEFPLGSLTGTGIIDGQEVNCIDPEYMLQFITMYEPRDKDIQDVHSLSKKFGYMPPSGYAKESP